jgi:hypothetical protein
MTYLNQPVAKKQQYDIFPMKGKGKMIIPKEVKSIIDILHNEVGSIEWCGILTYKKEAGHISDPESTIFRAVDIYPMDIGTHSYTEFDSDDPKEICDMYDRMPSYMDHRNGLIHTHHTMTTFFSGTDMQELHDNVANYDPYYLSLIVNFKGQYTAKVAYLQKLTSRDIEIKDEDGSIGTLKTQERELMFTFDLDVEIEGQENEHSVIMQRLAEIRDKKKKTTAVKGFAHTTAKTQNVQTAINFPPSFSENVRKTLPTLVMQNDKYKGTIWEAFKSVEKEIDGDTDKADMIYNIWAEKVYEQVIDIFNCQTHDEAEDIFKEIIKMLESVKNVPSYGDHAKKFIEVIEMYLFSIETN